LTPDAQFAIILIGRRARVRTIGGRHLVSDFNSRFGQLRQLHVA
jgi:hypothetical protein